MRICSLIGSLIVFKKNGISNMELERICEKVNNMRGMCSSHTIEQVYCELSDFDDCFQFKNDKIIISKYYLNNEYLLKKRFFDLLNDEEKRIVYEILNQL